MTAPKNILVPTDFSEPSGAALDYAVNLASKLEAKVTVVHAYELPIVGFPDGTMTISAEMAARIVNAAQKSLDDLAAKYASRSVAFTTILEQADPRDAVSTVAERIGADLIVMGTHGRRGIARALIGSVAERVVRTSPIPVLTVHAETGRRS